MAKQNNPDPNPSKQEVQVAWHALNAENVLTQLRSSETGLASDEVARRMQQYGPNELREKPRPTFSSW